MKHNFRTQLPPVVYRAYVLEQQNPMSVGDDVAVRRLPKHFGESHNWYD